MEDQKHQHAKPPLTILVLPEDNKPNMKNLKICVLQPDYSTSDVDYQNYDPPRDLSHLIPNAKFDHISLNKLSTYKQLKELKKKNYDVFVNLCEGYLEWNVPSIDVIYFMELLNLPFTGPSSLLYDPPKDLMKYVAYAANIKTPAFALIESLEGIEKECNYLKYPLFVKPDKAGDSLGIDQQSLVNNKEELIKKCTSIIDEYSSFRNHHGRWQQDSTRGIVVEQNKDHPVLKGVTDIWGTSDVYRTFKEGGNLPEGCLPLVNGQPLMGRNHDDAINPELIPLPVAWVKSWTGNTGHTSRVFNMTMGSAQDFKSEGVRRMTVNAVYWCQQMETSIDAQSCMDIVGVFNPPDSGFAYQKLNIVPRKPSFYR